jgi:sugar phosphate isomerase/epimerase
MGDIVAQERGIILTYHNQDFEFRPDAAGELIIDKLLASADPALLKLVLDVSWAAFAGVDPISFMHKHLGRIIALHPKDITPDHTFTEVSDGTLDIAGYTKATQAGSTSYFFAENDSPSIPSLESARRPFENIHRRLQWW